MNHFKHSRTAAIFGLLSRNARGVNAQVDAPPKALKLADLPSRRFDAEDETVRNNAIERIRYAQTLDGMLCARDPELLRRYILDARTEEEQAARQIALFKQASVALGCLSKEQTPAPLLPANSQLSTARRLGAGNVDSFDTTGVVNCGLFACPVVVTFAKPKPFLKRQPMDHQIQAHVAKALEQALAQFSGTPLQYVRVEALIAINDLNGITPLQVQTAVSNESRRMSGHFESSPVFIPQSMQSKTLDAYRRHQSGWSMKLPQFNDVWTEIGPDQPASFLLIAYFGWERSLPEPAFTDGAETAKFRLQSLLEGYLSGDRCTSHGEMGANASTDRVRVAVDKPLFIQDALTRAQAMQFQVMAKRAERAHCQFDLKHEQRATIQHWTARILPLQPQPQPQSQSQSGVHFDQRTLAAVRACANADQFDEPPKVLIEQIYEGFWRPQRHVIDIEQQLRPGFQSPHGVFNAEGESPRVSWRPVGLSQTGIAT